MWFGTYDGLNRYDGYEFKTFRNEINNQNSLSNNTVYSLEGDSSRNIWVGGNKGASVYDKSKGLFYPVRYKENEKSTTNVLKNVVHQIKEVSNGVVLMATQNSGLLVFEKGAFAAKVVPLKALEKVYNYDALAIQKDKKGVSSWVYVRDLGICNYNYNSKSMKLIAPLLMDVKCMETDNDGNLWIGTDEGLFLFNIMTHSISKMYCYQYF